MPKLELPEAATITLDFGTVVETAQHRFSTVEEALEHGFKFPILNQQPGRFIYMRFLNEAGHMLGCLCLTTEHLLVGLEGSAPPIPEHTNAEDSDSEGEDKKKEEFPVAQGSNKLLTQPQWHQVGKGQALLKGTYIPHVVNMSAKRCATNPRKRSYLFPVYAAPLRQRKADSPGCWICRKKFGLFRAHRFSCRICGLLCCRECMHKQSVDTGKDLRRVLVCLCCSHTFEAGMYMSQWEPDSASHSCRQCLQSFTTAKRRSHCRICGFLFCRPCLNPVSVVSGSARGKSIKACQHCTKKLQQNAKGLTWDDSVDRILYQLDVESWPPAEGDFAEEQPNLGELVEHQQVPALNVLILIVGSRGDVQPFIPLAFQLKAYGHRVRLATHECFRQFVTSQGIEFFPLGGDPKELMAYMVKTGGRLLPTSIKEIKEDVPAKRTMISEIMHSTWQAATTNEPGVDLPVFIADAIISNPPTYGHVHVAEALCVPLHMFFTMPWNPTRAFPHPMANLDNNKGASNMNYMSFQVIDHLMWAGTLDLVNSFRKSIELEPILMGENGSGLLSRVSVPFAYMWSPALIPKPSDWGSTIDVVGFSFLPGSGSGNWKPPADLLAFLAAGPPPIFVGFGSCVIPNPQETTKLIYEAARRAGVRLVLQRGWANLGGPFDKPPEAHGAPPAQSASSSSSTSTTTTATATATTATIHTAATASASSAPAAAVDPALIPPENVFVIGDAPHDWLFKQCRAVCHHGGAGTTAAGLLAGLPTIIVPFFGDQPFWGAMVAKQGSGPVPIPFVGLSADLLTEAFKFVGTPECVEKAKEMSARMQKEDGGRRGLEVFHGHLPVEQMSCDLLPTHCAKVFCEDCGFKLCPLADYVLHCMGERTDHSRSVYRSVDWRNHEVPTGAGSGVSKALTGASHQLVSGVSNALVATGRGIKSGSVKGTMKGMGNVLGASAKAGVILVDRMGKGFSNAGGHWTILPDNVDHHLHPSQQSHIRVQHVGDGLLEGGKSLLGGIVDGVGGVVMEPMLAAKRGESAGGIAKGVGRGFVGFFFKPAGGLLQLLSNVSMGVARTPGYIKQKHRAKHEMESVTQKKVTTSTLPQSPTPTPEEKGESQREAPANKDDDAKHDDTKHDEAPVISVPPAIEGVISAPVTPASSIVNHQQVTEEEVALVLSAFEAAKADQTRARKNIVRERRELADGVLKKNWKGELALKKDKKKSEQKQ